MVDNSALVLKHLAIWPLATVATIVIIGLFGYSIKSAFLGTVAAIKVSQRKLAQASVAARHRISRKK